MFTLDENLAESRIGIEPGHRETDPGKQAAARQKPPPKYPGTYRDARLVFIQNHLLRPQEPSSIEYHDVHSKQQRKAEASL